MGIGGRPCSVVGSVCTNSDDEFRSNPDHGAGSLKDCCFAFCAGIGGTILSVADLSADVTLQVVFTVVSADLDTDAVEVVVFCTDTDADAEDVAGVSDDGAGWKLH